MSTKSPFSELQQNYAKQRNQRKQSYSTMKSQSKQPSIDITPPGSTTSSVVNLQIPQQLDKLFKESKQKSESRQLKESQTFDKFQTQKHESRFSSQDKVQISKQQYFGYLQLEADYQIALKQLFIAEKKFNSASTQVSKIQHKIQQIEKEFKATKEKLLQAQDQRKSDEEEIAKLTKENQILLQQAALNDQDFQQTKQDRKSKVRNNNHMNKLIQKGQTCINSLKQVLSDQSKSSNYHKILAQLSYEVFDKLQEYVYQSKECIECNEKQIELEHLKSKDQCTQSTLSFQQENIDKMQEHIMILQDKIQQMELEKDLLAKDHQTKVEYIEQQQRDFENQMKSLKQTNLTQLQIIDDLKQRNWQLERISIQTKHSCLDEMQTFQSTKSINKETTDMQVNQSFEGEKLKQEIGNLDKEIRAMQANLQKVLLEQH